MIAAVTAAVALIAAALVGVGLLLAKRVVNATARPKLLRVGFHGQEVTLPESDRTTAAGEYLLHVTDERPVVLRVGSVVGTGDGRVRRALLDDAEGRSGEAEGYWSAHGFASPAEVGEFRTVEVPLIDGETREAWLFPGDPTHWAIHVQGIRTSRGVTLRTVAAAQDAGVTSLAITYRGAGDGPPTRAATLGAQEWSELRDAIEYARRNGAERVTVVAWSMGAALMLELLTHDPVAVDDLVLMCPVSSWPSTIAYGARQAGLPRQAAGLAALLMRSRIGAKLLGLPVPVDGRKLDWTHPGSLPVPTLIIHSQGDEVVPWETTMRLTANNPQTATLIETVACPHGYELTVPDAEASSALHRWLIDAAQVVN